MKCIEKGHIYELANRDMGTHPIAAGQPSNPTNQLTFANRQPGHEHGGTTTQEVIRALIDRTRHCGNCMPHPVNERIVYHLRMALALHEARALERRIERDGYPIEYAGVNGRGHLALCQPDCQEEWESLGEVTPTLDPHPFDGAKTPNHPNKDENMGLTGAKALGDKKTASLAHFSSKSSAS